MENEIEGSYESYEARIESLAEDRLTVFAPFADYSTGSFGSLVMRTPEAFPEDPDEKKVVLRAMRDGAKTITFFRFGSRLQPTVETVGSLEELMARSDGGRNLHHTTPEGGLPTIVDYSQAGSGKALLVTVTQEAFTAATRKQRTDASLRFTGHSWVYVLGYEPMPEPAYGPGGGQVTRPLRSMPQRGV